jgi:hypothetical protein
MKTKIFLLAVLFSFFSCNNQPDPTSMASILNKCEGKTIVVATGINEGNYDSYKYFILVRDSKGQTFEYVGAKYDVKVGSFLK